MVRGMVYFSLLPWGPVPMVIIRNDRASVKVDEVVVA